MAFTLQRRQVLLAGSGAAVAVAAVAMGQEASAQAPMGPIDISAFDGYEAWPLRGPGAILAGNAELADLRVVFGAEFPGPGGLGTPLAPTTMIVDVIEAYFHGRPALWIQWTSTSAATAETGAPALDYLVVDRETHRLLHRVQSLGGAQGPQTWAGPMAVINHPADDLLRTVVREDGVADTVRLAADATGTIDFASLPFWLPFIELEVGQKFRVPYYRGQLNEIGGLPIHVNRRAAVQDARGRTHRVWAVDVMSIGGAALTQFWISPRAPYFLGWDFRLVANGNFVSRMRYQRHWRLAR